MCADAQRDGRPAEYRWRFLRKLRNSIHCMPRRKVWLRPTAGVPCCNPANTRTHSKTWTQSEFCTCQNSVSGQEPPKCIYGVPAQETAKHPAKFCWPPLSDVGAVRKPRRETHWNLLGCLKIANRSQPLVGRSSPYCDDMWSYCCLASFFLIVDTCLSCEYIAGQSCAMVPWWRFLAIFCVLYFQRAACSTCQTCILNLR